MSGFMDLQFPRPRTRPLYWHTSHAFSIHWRGARENVLGTFATTALSFSLKSQLYPALGGSLSFTSYISEWIPVDYINGGGWNSTTRVAQQEIVEAADWFAAQGPWSVTSKTVLPPSNNSHDYLSWAPYYWPDCSNLHNTTVLPPEVVWTECDYVYRDGQFNPDYRLINDTGEFQAMSDAVFYNVLAWKISGNDTYANNVANFINTWFINEDTYMTPNLNYAQTIRGVNGSHDGDHKGVLDLHGMTKVTSAIEVLKSAGASAWTPALENGMHNWCVQYVTWLTNATIALQEKNATNNHGSYYYSQTSSILVYLGQYNETKDLLMQYFDGIYQNQILASGDQPLESRRTRPFHYRAYNAAAILTIHRIAAYLNWDTRNIQTAQNATAQTAVDYAMTQRPGHDDPDELYPVVASAASLYGDPDGKYAAFLALNDPVYPGEALFFWDQPLTDSNITVHLNHHGDPILGAARNISNSGSKKYGASTTILSRFSVVIGLFSTVTGVAGAAFLL